MKGLILAGKDQVSLHTDVPKPVPGHGQVLVKVVAAGLNPTDFKHVQFGYKNVRTGTVLGCDFAGVVEEVGEGVHGRNKGDRVSSYVHGASTNNNGSFSEYVVADANLLIPVPANVTLEQAATLTLASLTACQMLWQTHKELPNPLSPSGTPIPILVWSGASAVGQYVVQLASSSGLHVIATASPKHHAHLRSLGASATFDYRDPAVAQKIKEHTKGQLKLAADCVSTRESGGLICEAMSEEGGDVAILLVVDTSGFRKEVRFERSVAYTLFGKAFESPYPSPANPEHYVAAQKYVAIVSELLGKGKLQGTPVKLFRGLESYEEAFEYMRAGKVSGEKIVFKISEE